MPGARAVPRWLGYAAVGIGLVVNELTLEWAVVPDGEIGSPALRLAIVIFQLGCVAGGAYVLRRRPETRLPLERIVVAGASTLLTAFLTFALLDTQAPALLEIPGVRYFSVKARYIPDSVLVMTPRTPERTLETRILGDLYVPDGGVSAVDVPYRASFNELGFRVNSSDPPYDVVVIGDSYVEFGETDSLTLSEFLKGAGGLSTFNLGRAWYGPPQYVELLRRHGTGLEPSFALFCFFEGNDVRDVGEYLRWEGGGSYYHFGAIEEHLVKRFSIAAMDLASAAADRARRWVTSRGTPAHGTALLPGADGGTRMRFAYYPEYAAGELLQRSDGREIQRLLREFRDLSERNGIVPVVVFVPTKLTVYREMLEAPEGPRIEGSLEEDRGPSASWAAVEAIARELGIPLIDLTPAFRQAAREGRLLYYPADTHWSPTGRRLAARVIARSLADRWAGRRSPEPAAD